MKEFFNVSDVEQVLEFIETFTPIGSETVPLMEAYQRVLAEKLLSDVNLPGFDRSTMDGFAVRASSTFGASEGSPAFLDVKGTIDMGEAPDFEINHGEAARISTGGMMPNGADAVVMVEFTDAVDDHTIEVYKSVAPGQHVILKDEDFKAFQTVLDPGIVVRPQEMGLLAAFGKDPVPVFKKPIVGIISTGDEVIQIHQTPKHGQIRDINSYTLSGQVLDAGGIPKCHGIVEDDYDHLFRACKDALDECDMIMISGGSSVGMRDFTIEVLSNLPNSQILTHGIAISPGKPTILAKIDNKPFWGLPGHVVSAMVVFTTVVKPFLLRLCGLHSGKTDTPYSARISRNLPSAHGRTDYVRVRLTEKKNELLAEPVLGKSGLIHTMVLADGLLSIDKNTEGLDKGDKVNIIPV
jgi:molybdopterin molybdotransferase